MAISGLNEGLQRLISSSVERGTSEVVSETADKAASVLSRDIASFSSAAAAASRTFPEAAFDDVATRIVARTEHTYEYVATGMMGERRASVSFYEPYGLDKLKGLLQGKPLVGADSIFLENVLIDGKPATTKAQLFELASLFRTKPTAPLNPAIRVNSQLKRVADALEQAAKGEEPGSWIRRFREQVKPGYSNWETGAPYVPFHLP